MNLQQQFDFAVKNVRQQGTCSVDENEQGLYWVSEKVRCPGGWFLSKQTYSADLEGLRWGEVVRKLADKLPDYLQTQESVQLIDALVKAHDEVSLFDVPFFYVEDHFKRIANDLNLAYTSPN